jgi:signal recognition particle subunit SRP19
MKNKDMKTIIWPAYLDSKRTKGEGRKIPQKFAVSSPKLREISKAAERLKLNPEVENSKSYPKSWWETSGRVTVDSKQPKREMLIKISNLIKGSRT